MTAPNGTGVRRCIAAAVRDAGIEVGDIDAISGHLTATIADSREVENWAAALGTDPERFPKLVATKSLIGHALGAAGAIECVAVALMLQNAFLHPSKNCEDLHPDIVPFGGSVVRELEEDSKVEIFAKSGFGFGDVNACLIFRKWS
jgi:3-oxoacyl-(acyl-carrier-protein) synthase